MPQLTFDEAPTPRVELGPPTKIGISEWLKEYRARQEREERFERLLRDPAYLARLEAAVAELRACPQCHPTKGASA